MPNCPRCIDAFHVVEWSIEALDKVRRQSWHEAKSVAAAYGKQRRDRPKVNDEKHAEFSTVKNHTQDIKETTDSLGKAPENLTTAQEAKLEMI